MKSKLHSLCPPGETICGNHKCSQHIKISSGRDFCSSRCQSIEDERSAMESDFELPDREMELRMRIREEDKIHARAAEKLRPISVEIIEQSKLTGKK